jgi:2-oxoglutarate ferredoxin oxidoreductase subunit delta
MASVHGSVEIQVETCKGCELCVEACPQESLKLSKDINKIGYHYAVLIEDNCTGCTNCALVCPDAVITVYREKKGGSASSRKGREPVAVISNVKSNVKVVLDDVPKGKVNI